MLKLVSLALAASLALGACNNNNAAEGDGTKTDSDATMATDTVNALTDAEKSEGWEVLFDGKDLSGWHTYGSDSVASDRWLIEDGAITIDSTKHGGHGDLVSNQSFGNFHLKMEWKINAGSNSGIIFLVHEDTARFGATYQSGPEMQVVDNVGHPDGKIEKHQAGDLYDLIKSSAPSAKPLGEWNLAEIKVENGKLDLFLNGVNVVSTTMWDDNWKNLIANSKFKNWDGFGTFKKGKIALQDHGDPVWFRNIKVRKL